MDGQSSTGPYVRGILVPNNYNPNALNARFWDHSRTDSHIWACSDKVKISLVEPTEAKIKNKRLLDERILNYIENCLKPKFRWLEISEGKLFCKVRNMITLCQNCCFTLKGLSQKWLYFPSNRKLRGKIG